MDYKTYTVREYSNGDKLWYKNNKLHREDDKPAVENANGDKTWYKNGKLHREDGPAIEYPDGDKYWYLDGKLYTEVEYNKKIHKISYNIKGKLVSEDTIDEALKFWINNKEK